MVRPSRIGGLACRANLALRRALLLSALSFAGCSADAVPEPEPTFNTRGAYFALVVDGEYQLFRTLLVLSRDSQEEILFVVPYLATPGSFDEARELAKDPTLQAGQVTAIGRRYVVQREWRVVWFRSVSPEEEEEFR
jgi:hypothetical protein